VRVAPRRSLSCDVSCGLVLRFAPDRPNLNHLSLRVHVVKNSKFTDTQLPDRRHVFETRRQVYETFPVSRGAGRFMAQVPFDLLRNPPLVVHAQGPQFSSRTAQQFDFVGHRPLPMETSPFLTPRSPPNSPPATSAPPPRTPSAGSGTPACRS